MYVHLDGKLDAGLICMDSTDTTIFPDSSMLRLSTSIIPNPISLIAFRTFTETGRVETQDTDSIKGHLARSVIVLRLLIVWIDGFY